MSYQSFKSGTPFSFLTSMSKEKKPSIIIKVDAGSPSKFKVVNSSHPVEVEKRKPGE